MSSNVPSSAANKTKALKLKAIHPKCAWGGRPLRPYSSNLLGVHDHEFILATGTGFMYVENASVHTRKSFLVEPHTSDIQAITCVAVSKDGKYCASVVDMKGDDRNVISIIVYSTSNHMQDNFKPHEIKYTCPINVDQYDRIDATAISFSADSALIGILTNMPPVGVVILDHFKGGVIQTIATDSLPISFSFNPMDPFKICVTGELNFVKLWRFSNKSIHAAPVSGLKKGFYSYTAHSWVPPFVESLVVLGTDAGFICAIQNCEQRSPAVQVFGGADFFDPQNNAIHQILVRGDIIIVASPTNLVAVYEIRRTLGNKGVVGLSAILIPLARYRLEDVTRIYGLQFCIRESTTSYTLMLSSSTTLAFLDMITDFDLSGGALQQPPKASNQLEEEDEDEEKVHWKSVPLDKALYHYHSQNINCLSVAAHGSSFLTFSYDEATIRFWDYNNPNSFTSGWMTENFKEKMDDNPFHVDLHPNGLQIACASETEVKEYAVWDTQIDLIRRIPVRVPFKGTGGAPIVISQPVSFVKYSNGGHMLAVVTGKIAQIFHVFLKEEQQTTTFGSPFRVMTLTDHVAPITDLAFTRDDCGLVTSSNDGSVYSWIVGAKSRDKEFVKKGYAVTHVCVGKNQGCKTIIASFESVVAGGESTVPLANDVVRRRRQSSIAIRRSAKATNDRSSSRDFTALNNALRGSRGEALRGSRESKVSERSSNGGSQDLGPALAAFSSALNRPDGSPPGSPPIMGSPVATNKPFSSGDNSPGSAGNNATGNLSNTVSPFRQAVFTGATSAYTPSNIQKQAFLAVWEGEISSNPTIIQLPAVVKAIQLGRSSGPDSFDLCVIALADGQIILSMLPLPLMSLNDGGIPPPSAGPKVVNFSTGANIEHKRLSMAMIRMAPTKRSVNAGILAAVSEDDGGGGGTISSGMDNASRAAGGGYATTSADDASQSSTSISEDGFRSRANSVLPNASTGINLAPSASPTSTAIAETPPSSSSSDAVHHLNISQCRVLRLIVGGCSQIQFSPDGAWIFLGGQDGSVFLLSTMRKFAELPHHAQSQQQQQQSVEMQHRNELSKLQFLMVERTKMEGIRTKLIEMEHTLEQSQKDHELYIGKILEGREKLLLDLEAKMKREIVSRDETILQARNDYFQLKRSSAEELASLRKHCDESLSALELMYERRLAQEGVYLDKLKQAYDEYVVNLKMDMTSVQGQVETKMQAIEQEKHKVIVEAEKQKMAILNYYDYIKRRNEEVIASLEEQQSEERSKLKQQLAQTHAMLADAQAKNMSSEVQANHTISKLKVEIENKEVEILRVNSDLEWANDRIAKLENALQQATMELKARAELNEKWEGKAGEMTKRIEDLEKIRKTLTNQLHGLRDELAPKDDELHKAAEKLQEMDREYEISLHAITEKEKALAYKSQNLTLLQKQVRDLRKQASQKDVALRRSAVLLEEFIYSMHEVRFKPKSVGVNAAGNAIMGTAAGGDVAAITIPTALPVNSAAPTPMAADNGHKSRMNSIMPAAHSTLQHAALAALGAVNTNTSSTAAAPPTAAGVPSTASDPMENGANTSGKGQRTNQLSQPHSHDLIAALKLDNNVNLKLRRLNDVLKPYLTEGDVEAEIVDDIEQVRREQDRHMTLLHRNFSSLQSSLDTAQQVLNYKVHNHLTDNQTLLKEVNQLRSEVKSLSLENQRLAAQLEFMNARRQEQINAFNAQFLSTNSDIPPNAGLLGMAGVETSEPQSGRPLSQGRGGLNSTISMPSTPAVVFPALMPPGPIDAIGNARLAGSLSNKKTALFGSSSQPILSTMQSADPAVGREKSSREKALTPAGLGMSSAGSIGSASGTGSRRGQKPMKSIEELLDPTVASNSTAQTPTINPAPRMTADEKVARLVELNFQEIRATNSATATGASTPASATPNASTTSTRSQRKR